MGYITDTNSRLELPENIAQSLELALAKLPNGETAQIEKTSLKGTLNHTLLITTVDDRYIFRARRDLSLEELEEYMNCMFEYIGFYEIGGGFRIRTITEEIDFINQALGIGLPVPKIIDFDRDWMLSEYIEGKSFLEHVEAGEVEVLPHVLKQLHLAHSKGIVYSDRWGPNELIDSQGNVWMIDFDFEWYYQGEEEGVLEALEIAFPLFSSLRMTSHRQELLKVIQKDALPLLTSGGYRIDLIRQFFEGICNFDVDPDRPRSYLAIPEEVRRSIAESAATLNGMLKQLE